MPARDDATAREVPCKVSAERNGYGARTRDFRRETPGGNDEEPNARSEIRTLAGHESAYLVRLFRIRNQEMKNDEPSIVILSRDAVRICRRI